jgi:hypothetical protein
MKPSVTLTASDQDWREVCAANNSLQWKSLRHMTHDVGTKKRHNPKLPFCADA